MTIQLNKLYSVGRHDLAFTPYTTN